MLSGDVRKARRPRGAHLGRLPRRGGRGAKKDLQTALERARGKALTELAFDDARELVGRYATYVTARDVAPLLAPLLSEDDARRYDIDDDARITTRDGATLSAVVVRPRRPTRPEAAVLFFTIYTDRADQQARLSAAHGYVGITVLSRCKARSTDPIVPYEREADDTHDAIDWISKQPWNDGRVAMYGGSYVGFAQWAATKHLHPALKTIVPYVAAIPGQGLPMENNVFLNVNYGWAFYVTSGRYDDNSVYEHPGRT